MTVRLASVLTIGFPAAVAGTNCYVLAPSAGEECLVVDPGVGVDEHPSVVDVDDAAVTLDLDGLAGEPHPTL